MTLADFVVLIIVGLVIFLVARVYFSEESQISRTRERRYQRVLRRKLTEKIDLITQTMGTFGTFDGRTGYRYEVDLISVPNLEHELILQATFQKDTSPGYDCYQHYHSVHSGGRSGDHLVYRGYDLNGDVGLGYHVDCYLIGPWEDAIDLLHKQARAKAAEQTKIHRQEEKRRLGI